MNKPDSQAGFNRFPPSKYPLELMLMIGKCNAGLVQELKPIMDKQSGDESKYYAKVAKHVGNSITMRCYFKDVDSFRAVAWKLEDKNIWHDALQYESTKLTPRILIEKASSLLKKELKPMI
ncbi:MAG: hypothetical protein GYB31_01815 [Bacteroidetes bacterium]|nr:hypothetical protein [Bacteroidota bacterium]